RGTARGAVRSESAEVCVSAAQVGDQHRQRKEQNAYADYRSANAELLWLAAPSRERNPAANEEPEEAGEEAYRERPAEHLPHAGGEVARGRRGHDQESVYE